MRTWIGTILAAAMIAPLAFAQTEEPTTEVQSAETQPAAPATLTTPPTPPAAAIPAAPAPPAKRVEVDKSDQVLRAYEGNRLVLESPVSTGREGKSTPNGSFIAGDKFRMHRSRLYHNAPMPYSVQVDGNYFIHGFSSVPDRPASHGCVRLPINMAKRFYDWVETGTPITITGRWSGRLTAEGRDVRKQFEKKR